MASTTTASEREGWFNSGLIFLLVFLSFIWKGPNLKVRLIHAAILLAGFFIARALFARFNGAQPVSVEDSDAEAAAAGSHAGLPSKADTGPEEMP